MIRGAEISLNAPLELIRQVLAGVWNEYVTSDGWHVVATPVITVEERACKPGTYRLPKPMVLQGYATLVKDGSSEHVLLKPGQSEIILTEAAFVRIVQYGQGNK